MKLMFDEPTFGFEFLRMVGHDAGRWYRCRSSQTRNQACNAAHAT